MGNRSHGNILLGTIRGEWRPVTLGFLLMVVHQLAEVAVPVAIGALIDQAVAVGDGAAMARWMAVLAGLFVVLSFGGCVGLYVQERAITGATHRTRLLVSRRVLDPGGGVEDALPGEVVSLTTVETARIGEGVGAVLFAAGAVVGIVAATSVLLVTSVSLGLVVVLGLPALLAAVQVLSRPLVQRAEAHQAAVGSATGVAADLFTGLRVLKGLGVEATAATRYRGTSQSALHASLDANRVRSTYLGITLTAAGGFLVLVAWLGGRQALDGSISIGQLVAVLGITQLLAGPLATLVHLAGVLAQARASARRIEAALAAPPRIVGGEGRLAPDRDAAQPIGPPEGVETGGEPCPDATGRGYTLVLAGVWHETLQDLDLEVGAGQLVGIVAARPAEAAALVECLDGTARPGQGHVSIDGTPLGDLRLDEARRAVVVAHHDAHLFEGSLAENVAAVASPGADLEPALGASAADEVVDTVQGGLDAPVTAGGRSLSGGQRQRVALGRALAADPPVLVLHEPTTAVDAATEHRIATGLRSLRSGRRTTLLITASPALLAAADRVALLDGGRIVAEGSHAQLAATDHRYQEVVLS